MCDYYIWQRSFNKQIKLSGSFPFEYCAPKKVKSYKENKKDRFIQPFYKTW